MRPAAHLACAVAVGLLAGQSQAAQPLSVASVSSSGFLCFTSSAVSAATAYTPCSSLTLDVGCCAGAGAGFQYICRLFGRRLTASTTVANTTCYDSALHAAEGTLCVPSSIQSDDRLAAGALPQCTQASNAYPQYVYWCPQGSPLQPAQPPVQCVEPPPPPGGAASPLPNFFPASCDFGTSGECQCVAAVSGAMQPLADVFFREQLSSPSATTFLSASDATCDTCGRAHYCPGSVDVAGGGGYSFTKMDPTWFECTSGGNRRAGGGSWAGARNLPLGALSYSLCTIKPSYGLILLCLLLPFFICLAVLLAFCYLHPRCPIYQRRNAPPKAAKKPREEKPQIQMRLAPAELDPTKLLPPAAELASVTVGQPTPAPPHMRMPGGMQRGAALVQAGGAPTPMRPQFGSPGRPAFPQGNVGSRKY